MKTIALSAGDVDMLVELEKRARESEPDIWSGEFDEEDFRAKTLGALEDPRFACATCLVCVGEDGRAVGRLDFALLPSLAFGGDLRAYVDWVYVLKERRRDGVARLLFAEMERRLREAGAGAYFLVAAENADAQGFYAGMEGSRIERQGVLTKELRPD